MPETIVVGQGITEEGWTILCAISATEGELTRNIRSPLIVQLTVNGVEVSFSAILSRLREEAARWAFERARELLEERAEDLRQTLDKLSGLARSVEEEVKRQIRKILPEALTEEGRYS